MLATVENMERIRRRSGQPIAAPQVFAYSPTTGERYSASPGDYFYLPPTVPLQDAEGNAMILVREISTILYLSSDLTT